MTTEWEAIQRKFGNLPPAEVQLTEECAEEMFIAAAEQQMCKGHNFEAMNTKELNNFDEDELGDDDERVLEHYRRKRLEELRGSQKAQFGSLHELFSKTHFVDEVSNAGDVWVVCHLYSERNTGCQLMTSALKVLARKFPTVKFAEILSTMCIANFPASSTPALLVYKGGSVRHQWLGLNAFGGLRMTPDDVEWALSEQGIVESDLEENPHYTTQGRVVINILKKGAR
eukprot:Colp12_sorted_trinity150504_noHs@19276